MVFSLPSLWYIAPASAFLSLVLALIFFSKLTQCSEGTEKMAEIAGYVKEGAIAYLKRQYKAVGIVFAIIFTILFILSRMGLQGGLVPFLFLSGGLWSAVSGYLGMKTATNASARTAAACQSSLNEGLQVAFRGGAIMGLMVVGFGLLDISIWFFGLNFIYDNNLFNIAMPILRDLDISTWSSAVATNDLFHRFKLVDISNILLTYAMGASVMALFARVGGGIFTKAADVGADLVGKVEQNIPEDDPRNPATIADNVGDNVGDVAGMGADLFESYCGSILATTALGASLALSYQELSLYYVIGPMVVAGFGILFSILGIFLIRTKEGATQQQLLHSLLIGTSVSSLLIIACVGYLAYIGILTPGLFVCVTIGLLVGILIGQVTERYTSDTFKPTQLIAETAKEGPATAILSGISTGMKSTAFPVIAIVVGIMIAFKYAGGMLDVSFGIYGISFAAVGMLSTLGIQLATDAFGPIADNAGGNAEMSGLPKQVRERTDALDSLGNTTAATGKGFAIGSAALTALALMAAYLDSVKVWLVKLSSDGLLMVNGTYFNAQNFSVDVSGITAVHDPKTLSTAQLVDVFNVTVINPNFLCGIFIGAMVAFLFCSMTISAVGAAAAEMVNEVRRQFREFKGILDGSEKPDYAECVRISTDGALRSMIVPSFLAILTPIAVGLFLSIPGVLGLLTGALTCGFCLAITLNNAGGSWDNAKKYIEAGNLGGKGSDAHKAAVIGDTVGDPFKDTAGPSLNILIKLMTIVSIVFVGVVIQFG
ncbi:MAG: sodium-translocating pyrophosphatase [Actinobacteria bacterium]|nr:sodium-translocating pyrophosphatase [Actinomycetota bacterium]